MTEKDHIPVTVLDNRLDELTEETLRLFQNIYLKNYYGSRKQQQNPSSFLIMEEHLHRMLSTTTSNLTKN